MKRFLFFFNVVVVEGHLFLRNVTTLLLFSSVLVISSSVLLHMWVEEIPEQRGPAVKWKDSSLSEPALASV